MAKSKPIVLSGIQPSGALHIGNYLGSLKNFVELQNSGKYDCYFFVADLHAMTQSYDQKSLTDKTRQIVASYLAAGLDPQKSTIFVQSLVPGHTELGWIFNTLTPMGELSRMTQFKDKSARQEKNINIGLFDYPVLQAADILLYRADFVPVGQDQIQHLELTNKIVKLFNNRFGQTFADIKPLLTATPKIMSLLEPQKKMSKSLGESHCIFITDDAKTIAKKLSRAVSDTGDGASAGGQNLLTLLDNFSSPATIKLFAEQKKKKALRFGDLKKQLAVDIAHHFADFRKKYLALEKNSKAIDEIIVAGSRVATEISIETMREVRKKVGLLS